MTAGLTKKVKYDQLVALRWVVVEQISTAAVILFYAIWINILYMGQSSDFTAKIQLLAKPGQAFGSGSAERKALTLVLDTLRQIATWMVYLRFCAVVAVLGLGFRILSRFRFHPRLDVLTRTVTLALHQFVGFFVVFVTIFASFAVAGAALFGDRVQEFSTVDDTIKSCINMLFGSFDVAVIQDLYYHAGAVYYWSYMIVVALVLLNMMLAIVVDTYSEIREESQKQPNDLNFARTAAMIAFDWYHLFRAKIIMVPAKNVVLLGRVIAFEAVTRALEAEPDGTKLLTPASMAAMFPQSDVTPRVAAITLYHLFKRKAPPDEKKTPPKGDNEAEPTAKTATTMEAFDAASTAERLAKLEEKLDLLLEAMQTRGGP
ncbi:hypothetical protein P43SY_005372 [Pythium insidiosum]|uniref:Polycystin cation channel PKD1/PKD2 domain-containing protein n=1 Tax=Pythium insidiosum TaxID=114742 RepID=A0AAD5LI97_PYTIN|nr:hypothetical protein P43SY_005372 [Pythium insidiosum]